MKTILPLILVLCSMLVSAQKSYTSFYIDYGRRNDDGYYDREINKTKSIGVGIEHYFKPGFKVSVGSLYTHIYYPWQVSVYESWDAAKGPIAWRSYSRMESSVQDIYFAIGYNVLPRKIYPFQLFLNTGFNHRVVYNTNAKYLAEAGDQVTSYQNFNMRPKEYLSFGIEVRMEVLKNVYLAGYFDAAGSITRKRYDDAYLTQAIKLGYIFRRK